MSPPSIIRKSLSTMRAGLSTLRRAAMLDLYTLNYKISGEAFRWIDVHPDYKPRGVLYSVLTFFSRMLKSLPYAGAPLLRAGSVPRGAILAFAVTRNQLDAIRPLAAQLDRCVVVTAHVEGDTPYPLFRAYLQALLFFPVVFRHYLKAEGYQRRTYRAVFHEYWLTYGHYLVACRLLRRLTPAAVVVANDHVMWTLALCQAAREQGIPTVYLQHASVIEAFPALSFDYAFLDGRDALAKYDAKGRSETRAFLVGTPKFDRFHAGMNTNRRVQALAICTNPMEPDARARALCGRLSACFPAMRIVLRPHPADTRRAFWQRLAEEYRLTFSDPATEIAFEMLQGVDAVVAGDSSVLLEAALLDVFAIYYDFSQAHNDYYGFVEQGLAPYTSSPEALEALVRTLRRHKPSIRAAAQYYCATVNTAFDGRSADVAAALTRQILDGRIAWEHWQRVPAATNLDAFELKTTGHARHAA